MNINKINQPLITLKRKFGRMDIFFSCIIHEMLNFKFIYNSMYNDLRLKYIFEVILPVFVFVIFKFQVCEFQVQISP